MAAVPTADFLDRAARARRRGTVVGHGPLQGLTSLNLLLEGRLHEEREARCRRLLITEV